MKSIRLFKKISLHQQRQFSLIVKYASYGNPTDVLKLENTSVDSSNIKNNEVLLKVLASPINPSDFNMVEGTYGINKALPAIAGTEFSAKVLKVGSGVSSLKEGDWVVPHVATIGAWRQELIVDEKDVVKAPNDIGACYAATLSSPCTSLRLLRDFVHLKPGDVIIQNAANSMIGYGVIQFAREFGYKTINIVRDDRPEADLELRLLTNLGGTVNLLASQVNNSSFKELLADLPPSKLALNAVGGESAVELVRALSPGGTMVTYGGMSRQAPVIPLDLIADKNLHLRSFWMTKWSNEHSKEEKIAMFEEIGNLIKDGQLAYFFELHDLDDFDWALKRATTPYMLRKVVLDMNFPDRMAEHDQLTEWDYNHFKFPPLKH